MVRLFRHQSLFTTMNIKEIHRIVCYQEVDLPVTFPNHLRKYIPNMYWDTHINPLSNPMRVVALVALRDIQDGEELFSTYMDLV